MTVNGRARLVLFDIDGTLLSSGPPAKTAFSSALVEVFGTAGDVDNYRFEGRLDPLIVIDLMKDAGIPQDVVLRHLKPALDRYLDNLEAALSARKPVLKPGVESLLCDLRPRDGVVSALLTGNVERGARIKLSAAGIWDFFRFGAWGDEGKNRNELGPVALARARQVTGHEFEGRDCVVVGDSRYDVECGKAIGARVVAVATGLTHPDVLAGAGADAVLPDLGDMEAARRAILG